MRNETIRFVAYDNVQNVLENKQAYHYRKDRPFPWLQRLCIYILKELGCYAMETSYSLKQVTVSPKSVMEALYEQKELVEKAFHRKCTRVIMGGKNYYELMKETQNDPVYMKFAAPCKISVTNRIYRGETFTDTVAFNMVIEVVPWLDGFIALP